MGILNFMGALSKGLRDERYKSTHPILGRSTRFCKRPESVGGRRSLPRHRSSSWCKSC